MVKPPKVKIKNYPNQNASANYSIYFVEPAFDNSLMLDFSFQIELYYYAKNVMVF